jgi:hypothetical protein
LEIVKGRELAGCVMLVPQHFTPSVFVSSEWTTLVLYEYR